MSEPPWSTLAAPFPTEDVRWHAVDLDAAAERIRLAPHLDPDALRRRLDRAVGPGGWSVQIRAWDEERLVAELTVRGVSRAAVVRVADGAGLTSEDTLLDAGAAASGAAWSAAARGFGMLPSIEVADEGWVDAARGGREPLHAPSVVASHARPAPNDSIASDALEPRPARAVTADATGTGSDARGAAPGNAGIDSGAPDAADAAAASNAAPKPEAHQVIDRLVERLRDEGLGADAARLVARYGGYGADVAASRELYAKLRALLLDRAAPG